MEQEQKRLLIRGARILNPARGEDYIGNPGTASARFPKTCTMRMPKSLKQKV